MKKLGAVGFAGSLREASFNRALLRAAIEVAPDDMDVDPFDLADVPIYNGDVEAEGDPRPVTKLKEAIGGADLVVIATPEYNQSMPAVIKNAVDWGSRPPRPQVWDGKPVVIMGTSPGRLGTVSAQRALRETLAGVNARVMPQPRIILPGANDVFADGVLVDEETRTRLQVFMTRAGEWARRFMSGT